MKLFQYRVSLEAQKKWVASLVALFLLFGNVNQVLAAEDAEEKTGSLYSLSAVLMDAKSGRVLLGKEEDVMRPMASTTKILTCILALEESNVDDIVTASERAAAQPKVHIGMQKEEQYFLEDLLYSLMLESHNDSAVAIAEHVAGSVEAFAELMNKKAEEIGCESAHFVTPNGIDGSDEGGTHSISARDLALILRYCMLKSPKAQEFLTITQTKKYSFQEITGKRTVSCVNHNALLDMMDGAVSGKTGFTGDAGYCYVGAVEKEGKTLIVALLGCGWPNNKSYKWKDATKLIDYGITHYEMRDIWENLEVSELLVEKGIPQNQILFEESYVGVEVQTNQAQMELLVSEEEKVAVEVDLEEKLHAPVKKGAVIGTVTYTIGEAEIASYDIVTTARIEKENFKWFCQQLFEKYFHFK